MEYFISAEEAVRIGDRVFIRLETTWEQHMWQIDIIEMTFFEVTDFLS